MIVGTTTIEIEELKEIVESNKSILDYSLGLVPTWARHIRGIVHNQQYLVAVTLRNINTIPYKKRKPVIDKLLSGVALIGVANNVCSIYDIVDNCNKDKLMDALKRENDDA